MDKEVKLGPIIIITKCSDGNCRQLIIDRSTEEVVLSAIANEEGKIRILDKVIEDVDIIKQNGQSKSA